MLPTSERIEELLPSIAAGAEALEQNREIPPALMAELTTNGCFRMLAPDDSHQSSLPDVLCTIESLARADGAVGWIVGHVALTQAIFRCFQADTVRELFSAGPDLLGAGAFAPKGRASYRDGGWVVSGQWPFVSGCEYASWFYLQCVVVKDRSIQLHADGTPLTRMMLLPAAKLEIVDTWRVIGLRGTGSHDVRVKKVFCPDAHSYEFAGSSAVSTAFLNLPLMDYAGLFIGAIALGISRGSLADLVKLARDKRPAFSDRLLSDSQVFQYELGKAEMTLRAARALLYAQANEVWDAAVARRTMKEVDRVAMRATAFQVTNLASQTLNAAYRMAGGSSIYDDNPIQRRFRDMHAVSQHAWNGEQHPGALGQAMVGYRPHP